METRLACEYASQRSSPSGQAPLPSLGELCRCTCLAAEQSAARRVPTANQLIPSNTLCASTTSPDNKQLPVRSSVNNESGSIAHVLAMQL